MRCSACARPPQCRRVRLLDYFGEAATRCGNCDNCLERPEEWDGTVAAQKLLSCIARCESATGFSFGAQHIIDILRGNRTAKVEQFRHERLSTFGIGANLEVAQWRSLLRQLVMLRLVQVDTDRYSVLRSDLGLPRGPAWRALDTAAADERSRRGPVQRARRDRPHTSDRSQAARVCHGAAAVPTITRTWPLSGAAGLADAGGARARRTGLHGVP